MACRQITYSAEASKFGFGEFPSMTFEEVGSHIGAALAAGKEIVDLGAVRVTVNYLTTMMRFARKNGWFNDSFDLCVGDHDFDMNKPTPGFKWNEIVTLRASIREARVNARKAAAANHSDEQYWTGEADKAAARVTEYLRTGE